MIDLLDIRYVRLGTRDLVGADRFDNDGEVLSFEAGDALFVAAGRPHRFIDFSDDFATWVVFYGPEGGEQP